MNVLVLMCDHLRYDALSCQGAFGIPTPNLDRLAYRSVRFHNAYCQAPVCGPTRHTLATGRYPYEHGVITNKHLPHEPMRTVAHCVREIGTRAHCYGHMHWQRLPDTTGHAFPDHGYEHYGAISADDYPMSDAKRRRSVWEHLPLTSACTAGVTTLGPDDFLGAHVTGESIAQLRAWHARGERFLSWTSFNEPHPPWYVPAAFYSDIDQAALPAPTPVPDDASPPHPAVAGRFREQWALFNDWDHRRMRAGYFGLLRMTDAWIGEILDEVDRLDLWKDTAVIFTADHGDMLGEHDLYAKFVFYESATHVPMMIAAPSIRPGDRQALVEHTDVLPTICELAGAPKPDGARGRSLVPLLASDPPADAWREVAFSQLGKHAMVRTHRHKLNVYDGRPGELFDLEADPGEFYNMIEDPAAAPVVDRLLAAMRRDHPDFDAANEAILRAGRLRRKKRKPAVTFMDTP